MGLKGKVTEERQTNTQKSLILTIWKDPTKVQKNP